MQAEVLEQVSSRLPPELRLLDAVQRLPHSEARVEALKRGVQHGRLGRPAGLQAGAAGCHREPGHR